MGCSFLFLRRLIIVGLVGVFVSVNTFIGEAVADDTNVTSFQNTCTLTPTIDLPSFENPPFAYADNGPITLDPISGTFTLDGDTSKDSKGQQTTYNGYLYGNTYYDKDGKKQTLSPTYNPPTIVVSPGNSIDLDLTNDLPLKVELEGSLPQTEQNLENQSQDTNLHYHGFNVSPLLGSDDVVMHVHSNVTPITQSVTPTSTSTPPTILPGGIYPGDSYPGNKYSATTKYHMQVDIPDKHQSGLFWYHPHVHTVSAQQVRAGMSGGIIVTDDRKKSVNNDTQVMTGTINMLEDNTKAEEESNSDTFDFLKKETKSIPSSLLKRFNSIPNQEEIRDLGDITQQVMMFKDFDNKLGTTDDPNTTNNLDCFTVNGQLNPKITIQPGEVQFWRVGNIGSDNYLNLALEKNIDSNPQFAEPNKQKNFIILGRDGGSVKHPVLTDSVLIPPASRVDVLVVGGNSGDKYNFVSDFTTNLTTKQQQWVNKNDLKSYQLATVSVEGEEVCYKTQDGQQLTPDGSHCEPANENLYDYIAAKMPNNVDPLLPDPDKLVGYSDCEAGQDHAQCITPSDEYENEPLTKQREFKFSGAKVGDKFLFAINGELYDENRIDKVSHLGDIEEWRLVNSTPFQHAFHMHQLDFLASKVDFEKGHDPMLKKGDTYDNYKIEDTKCDPDRDGTYPICYDLEPQEYRDMINLPPHSQTIIRIPFLNPFITGVFVYHCHILAHEDRGMMQNLKVIDPKSYKSSSGLASNS